MDQLSSKVPAHHSRSAVEIGRLLSEEFLPRGPRRILEALSPRLLQAPEQQVLMISNQRDVVQSSDAYFQYEDVFINQMRTDYCGTKDLPGVHWYLTSDTESVHVVTIREEFWLGEVDGVVMADWLAQAIESPESMESFAEEGEFVAAVAGVEPFPCAVAE